VLKKGARITGAERSKLATDLRKQYDRAGAFVNCRVQRSSYWLRAPSAFPNPVRHFAGAVVRRSRRAQRRRQTDAGLPIAAAVGCAGKLSIGERQGAAGPEPIAFGPGPRHCCLQSAGLRSVAE